MGSLSVLRLTCKYRKRHPSRVPHCRRVHVGCLKIGAHLKAPIAQSAEAVDLKSIQSGFESQWGHYYQRKRWEIVTRR